MANSEYKKQGNGAFASTIALDAEIGRFDTEIAFTRSRISRPIEPGAAAMVGDEIMRVEAVGDMTITVKRGCADTVPDVQPANSVVWIFDSSTVGGDHVERSASETVAVKVSPFTVGGGGVLPEDISPKNVEFGWRFFRPYPPGRVMVNGQRFTMESALDDTTPALHLTWAHRDRVLQADQLVGHDDDPVGPEPGTTYTVRLVDPLTHDVLRTEVGVVGSEFVYRRVQALHDTGAPQEVLHPTFTLASSRDGFESWQHYTGTFTLAPSSAALDVPLLDFAQRVIEAPYAAVLRRVADNPLTNHALAVGARPADRMADAYELFVDGALANTPLPAVKPFTPWIVSNFRLPELETTINVRASSFHDGVPLSSVAPGQVALVDDEIVVVVRVDVGQVEVRRGCFDTVPAVHLAGARVWFFEAACAYDSDDAATGSSRQYALRPVSYGTPHVVSDLPSNGVTFIGRAALPYPPGRIVVNGRPWFEQATALAGTGVFLSWARRNRIAQAGAVLSHVDQDQEPEAGQVTRLRFFYETPAANPGDPVTENVLRDADLAGTLFNYTYAMAQADGDVAGRAMGVCGTVVILCRIYAIRDTLASLQSYVVPIRVPSYPC